MPTKKSHRKNLPRLPATRNVLHELIKEGTRQGLRRRHAHRSSLDLEERLKQLLADPAHELDYTVALNECRDRRIPITQICAIGERAKDALWRSERDGWAMDEMRFLQTENNRLSEWLDDLPSLLELMEYRLSGIIDPVLERFLDALRSFRASLTEQVKHDLLHTQRLIPPATYRRSRIGPPRNQGRALAHQQLRKLKVPQLTISALLIAWGFSKADE